LSPAFTSNADSNWGMFRTVPFTRYPAGLFGSRRPRFCDFVPPEPAPTVPFPAGKIYAKNGATRLLSLLKDGALVLAQARVTPQGVEAPKEVR